MQLTRYKIYRINAVEQLEKENGKLILKEGNYSNANLVSISENFCFEYLRVILDKKYKKDMIIDEVILVELPANDKECKELQQQGFWIGGKLYKYFLSSPSWQKQADGNYKGVMLFAHSNYGELVGALKTSYENLISLDKIKSYVGENKDIAKECARLSLGLTSAKLTGLAPKFVVIENPKRLIKDMVLYYDDEIKSHDICEQEIENELFDGMGLVSFNFADELATELALDYTPAWFQVRQYGLATKGVLTKIDFHRYFKEKGIKTIKDKWGREHSVDDIDVIYTTSMTKWEGNFNSISDYYYSLEQFKQKITKPELKKMISNIWISKYEKSLEALNRLNYQLLGNIAITKSELQDMTDYTLNVYKDVINNVDDKALLFLGDIAKEDNFECENICSNEDDELKATTKAHMLLQLNPALIKSQYVQKSLHRMVEKSVKEMSMGRLYANCAYNTIVQDPIALLDYIVTGDVDGIGLLGAKEYYCNKYDDNHIVTCSRNPLNSYAEILNCTIKKNQELDKWYGHLNGMFVTGTYDLTHNTWSGCDTDGDTVLVVDNETIRNSVIEEYPIVNLSDGQVKAKKREWTTENVVDQFNKAKGNLIGSLSNLGACYSCIASHVEYFIIDEFNNLVDNPSLSEKDIKEQLVTQFKADKNKDFTTQLTMLQMFAIDSPKTGYLPTVPKELNMYKRPRFFMNNTKRYIKHDKTFSNWSALNLNSNYIYNNIGKEIKDDMRVNKDLAQRYYISWDYINSIQAKYNSCIEKIRDIYTSFKKEEKHINKVFKDIKTEYENDEIEEDIYRVALQTKVQAKEELYLRTDELVDELKEQYSNDYKLIGSSASYVCTTLHSTESFLFRFFFEEVSKIIKDNSQNCERIVFVEDEKGSIEYLGKRYKKKVIKPVSDNQIENLDKQLKNQNSNSKAKKIQVLDKHKVALGFFSNKQLIIEGATFTLQRFEDRGKEYLGLFSEGRKVAGIYYETWQVNSILNLYHHFTGAGVIVNEVIKDTEKRLEVLISTI